MTYHIEQAPVEAQDQPHRYLCDYQNVAICCQIATVISRFDPYSVYSVVADNGDTLATFWHGEENKFHAAYAETH